MSKIDDDIRKVLDAQDELYDLELEEGVFRQMTGIFRGKMRWMAIVATIESIVFPILIVLAGIQFFKTDDTRMQIFYATGVVLMAMLLLLVKLWGWGQMNRHAIQREIKRLELRVLEGSDAASDATDASR